MNEAKAIARCEEAAALLPPRFRRAALQMPDHRKQRTEEFRLRVGQPPTALLPEGEVSLPYFGADSRVTPRDLAQMVDTVTDYSRYACAETLRQGFLCLHGGFRLGVCGTAVLRNGAVASLRDISSLCIRLPHRIYGVSAPLYEKMRDGGFHDNVLIYSLPGHGKTTLLRELIPLLASGENALRIAVIDTRCELYGTTEDDMADVLFGYPRALGMETAIRTLSPQMILCDELMTTEDLTALESCVRCGIPVCATMHAAAPSGIDTAFRRHFSLFCAVTRTADGEHRYTYQRKEGERLCTV